MKQVIQSFKSGQLTVRDVPAPNLIEQGILMTPHASLVSAGTERMIVDFGKKNLWQKARSRPDLVRQTMDKAKREGILSTVDAVRNQLDQPVALGYSCAGRVIEVTAGLMDFGIGGSKFDGAFELFLSSGPIPIPEKSNLGQHGMRFTDCLVQLQRSGGGLPRFRKSILRGQTNFAKSI